MSKADAETLRANVTDLIGEAAASARFGIAVSGGPDSLALLLLASAAFPGRVMAASVNHRLRPAAAEECAGVAATCATMKVPHNILTPETPPKPNQAGARDLRYQMLEAWRAANGIDWLMTGHHADDQLETLVMRLNRSSGVGGLASVRARNGRVLRPLLSWRRDDLAAIVAAAGITAVDDPSNRDPRHDRARLRMAMGGQVWLNPVAVAASVEHLAQADEALAWATDRLIADRTIRTDDGVSLNPSDMPHELLLRVSAAIFAEMGATPPRRGDLARLLERVGGGTRSTLADIAVQADAASQRWQFSKTPPHRGARGT